MRAARPGPSVRWECAELKSLCEAPRLAGAGRPVGPRGGGAGGRGEGGGAKEAPPTRESSAPAFEDLQQDPGLGRLGSKETWLLATPRRLGNLWSTGSLSLTGKSDPKQNSPRPEKEETPSVAGKTQALLLQVTREPASLDRLPRAGVTRTATLFRACSQSPR